MTFAIAREVCRSGSTQTASCSSLIAIARFFKPSNPAASSISVLVTKRRRAPNRRPRSAANIAASRARMLPSNGTITWSYTSGLPTMNSCPNELYQRIRCNNETNDAGARCARSGWGRSLRRAGALKGCSHGRYVTYASARALVAQPGQSGGLLIRMSQVRSLPGALRLTRSRVSGEDRQCSRA